MSSYSTAPPLPPLQAYKRLLKTVQTSSSSAAKDSALTALLQHLNGFSYNVKEVESLENWCHAQKKTENLASVIADLKQTKSQVESRLHTVEDRLISTSGTEAARARAAQTSPADGISSTSLSLSLFPTDRTPSLVRWWDLSADRWNQPHGMESCIPRYEVQQVYSLSCLKEVYKDLQPYLSGMTAAGLTDSTDALNRFYREAERHLLVTFPNTNPLLSFGFLELIRALVVLLCGSTPPATLVNLVPWSTAAIHLSSLSSWLGKGNTTPKTSSVIPPLGLALSPSNELCYLQLIMNYSTFFHTVAAYIEGTNGDFSSLASSLLGSGEERCSALWGTQRYPFLEAGLLDDTDIPLVQHGDTPPLQRTRLWKSFALMESYIGPSSSDVYFSTFAPLVKCVIAPASSFSTLLLLSAIATMPLHLLLDKLSRTPELCELYEPFPELAQLILALSHGRLGEAWSLSCTAATQYLNGDLHISDAVLGQLLQAVKKSLCYNYLTVRRVACFEVTARDLHFSDPDSVLSIAEELISDGFLDARIDAVHGEIVSTSRLQREMEMSANAVQEIQTRAALSATMLEKKLGAMSVERHFGLALDKRTT